MTSSSSPQQRLHRLLTLVDALRSGERYSIKELAELADVSTRTVHRDLRELSKFDVEVVRESSGTYRLATASSGPLGLSETEATTLLLTCQFLGFGRVGLPQHEILKQIGEKLYAAFPPALRKSFDQQAATLSARLIERAKPDRTQAFYDLLLSASIARRRVRIRYHSLSEDSFIETDLAPYRLLFAKRTWYCIGHSLLHREVRTFHLGRIGTLEALEKSFRIPRSFSLDEYFGNAWRLIRGDRVHSVRLRFQEQVAQNVAEIVWHPTQKVHWQDDGSLLVDFNVAGLHELSWWILGYGEQVEVLEPNELRDIIRGHIEAMQAVYRPNEQSREEDSTVVSTNSDTTAASQR